MQTYITLGELSKAVELYFTADDPTEAHNYISDCVLQPERLNEKTYYRNEDGTYPPLEPVIGCDSLTSTNK